MKSKILDYIIIFLLAFLIINFFQWSPKKQEQIKKTWIILDTKTSSYTVPASINLNIENNSKNQLDINTCKDIKIIHNWVEEKIEKKDFCKDIKIKPDEKKTIKFQKVYEIFNDSWEYTIKLKTKDKEVLTHFNTEIRWTIWKFFTFFFYAPIYNLIVFLLKITNYSLFWAIVIITILIRIILIWPQHKMLVNQKKMQVIQPKIKALQEKHKWNHQVLWQEMMKLYKEENVNPMGSCGLMLIQMPILLVLYNIILYIKDESNLFYLYSFLQPFDIEKINPHFYSMDLYWVWGKAWLILAIVVWLLQFIQIKYSFSKSEDKNSKKIEKKEDKNSNSMMPDPQVMQKFMLFVLPIMIWVATYHFPAWLWIYWGMTTLFMLVQQLIVNNLLSKSS